MDIPVDALVEILLLLPPSSRRRCRLVSRLWRDVVDTRTTEMQSRAKPLVVTMGSAFVVDDLSTRSHRLLWTDVPEHHYEKATAMVGTCNGLICVCDNHMPGGAITVVNPVTGETLAVPPPGELVRLAWSFPGVGIPPWHEAYSFAYHPTTGRYKVVHVPCDYGDAWTKFDTLQVFTLGEASWLSVAVAPDETCTSLEAGVVSVDGTTYWATRGARKVIMAVDLDGSRVTPVNSPPNVVDMLSSRPGSWNLVEVRGRLGVACCHSSSISEWSKTQVWVLEGATTGKHRWSCWYNVLIHSPHHSGFSKMRTRHLTRPHFVHGEGILTQVLLGDYSNGLRTYGVSKHRTSKHRNDARCYMVEISKRNQGMVVGAMTIRFSWDRRIFSYVETTEPLSIYMPTV